MRNFQVRSDGPPDYEWFGSFDGFQTEFSISQLVEEKFTSTNIPVAEIADEMDYIACTLGTITKDGLDVKLRQWCRQLRNR